MQKTTEKTLVLPMKKEPFFKRYGFLIRPALSLLGALVLAKGRIFSRPIPLGIAFMLASEKELLPFSVLGTLLGYLFSPPGTESGAYLAATLLSSVVKALQMKKAGKKRQDLRLSALAGASVFLSGMVLSLGEGYFWYDLLVWLADGFFAAGSCWFFCQGLPLLSRRDGLSSAGEKPLV